MPKKTYKRKHRSMSKRSRGMKRYKKAKRTRSRGGNNDTILYNNQKPIINYDKDYSLMYNKPNPIINNDKFKYYSSPSNNINDNIITKNYNTSYKDDIYEKS
jgi:hypothetical protein